LRRAWGVDDATFVYGSVGRIVREKGMDLVARAFSAAFPESRERVALVIVGGGAQQDELRRIAEADGRISWVGMKADIAPFYRAFDAYVSAARFEPFGFSILEAMDAGLPLVLTRTDGPREFVSDERALWSDIDDEAGLAQQLRTVRTRGRVGFSYDLARFSLANATGAIESFYRRVIARASCASSQLFAARASTCRGTDRDNAGNGASCITARKTGTV
jgi:glycosyltransferase involved in cell wall biosynthesis